MNVRNFIKWLETQDQDLTIKILKVKEKSWGIETRMVDVKLNENVYVLDDEIWFGDDNDY